MARPYTTSECGDVFLGTLSDIVDWMSDHLAQDSSLSPAEAMDQLVFHILVVLDGESALPAFELRPAPHPDDAEYHKQLHKNWWPSDVDIAGDLHDRWANRKRGPR